jgi:hypothetical protein
MTWQPIETAPRDGTPVQLAGFWDNPGFPGTGQPFQVIAAWSTLSSSLKDAEYDWFSHGIVALSRSLVKLTHWMPLPPPPEDKP